LVAAGLLCLAFGSDFFVDGAVQLARIWGMSELVIGLTIVAAGTSLPEVATSITAAIKGQREIAVGNVIGSNLFNLLGVLGVSAAVSPAGLPISGAMLRFDFPVMWVVAALSLPIMFTGARVSRGEGLFLFCGYVGYTAFLLNR
jgi:cation:H+ antiporter